MNTPKKASKKEATGSPEGKPAAAKKLPVKVIRVGDVSVSVFAHERELGGIRRVNYSCNFSRSYKDASGAWKRTPWFGQDDLRDVVACAQQAGAYIAEVGTPEA
jgi:hypothetical protein